MTKGEIIEQAYIQILGGVLSQDSNVKRVDIENLLPSVMALSMTNAQYQGRAEARAEAAAKGYGSYTPPIEYYKDLVLSPIIDEHTCKYYIDLPKLLDLPNNWNITTVRPKHSFSAEFIRVRSSSELIGAPITGQYFFWVTNYLHGHRMWLSSVSIPIQDVVVTAAVSPSALQDDDEVPCPPSVEQNIVAILVQTYRQQRGTPGDPVLDDKDINDAAK